MASPLKVCQGAAFCLAWLSCIVVSAGAQPTRHVETGFERDVNRYAWGAGIVLDERLGPYTLFLQDRFTSDAYILFSDRLSFRDENQLAWRISRPFGSRLTAGLFGHSAWFSQSSVFSQEIYAALRVQPLVYASFEPLLGVAWDRRQGVALTEGRIPLRTDAGPAYGWRMSLVPPPLDGYQVYLRADGTWQAINPRRGRSMHLSAGAERMFEQTRVSLQVSLAGVRRDAYQAVSFLNRDVPTDRLSETVEATVSDTLEAAATLETPIYGNLRLTGRMDLGLNNRRIQTLRAPESSLFFDTRFSRSSVDAELALLYEVRRLMIRMAVQNGAEIERRELTNTDDLPAAQAAQKTGILRQADYDRGHLTLLTNVRASLSDRLALSLQGASSILRHDTPQANLDDRDEVYHQGEAGIQVTLSRYLQADVRAFGTYSHTVYLDGARSAENAVQRSIRLRPGLTWSPGSATRVRLSPEVRATYTVDDFVLPGRQSTDQSARELRYDGEVEHDFGSNVRVRAQGSYSTLFLGRLLWNEFAEIPFDTLNTYSGWLRLQTGERIVGEIGLRFFIRSDFDRSVTVRYGRTSPDGADLVSSITRTGRVRIEQIGPTCSITWPTRFSALLRLDGWLNIQHIRRRLYGDLPSASAEAIREAGRRGTSQVIPNLRLAIRWNL